MSTKHETKSSFFLVALIDRANSASCCHRVIWRGVNFPNRLKLSCAPCSPKPLSSIDRRGPQWAQCTRPIYVTGKKGFLFSGLKDTGWPIRVVKTSRLLGFGIFCHSAWAVAAVAAHTSRQYLRTQVSGRFFTILMGHPVEWGKNREANLLIPTGGGSWELKLVGKYPSSVRTTH